MDTDFAQDRPKIAILGRIVPLEDAKGAQDDWTGVTSTAERKKRQNRINQRAHRRRKNAQRGSPITPQGPGPISRFAFDENIKDTNAAEPESCSAISIDVQGTHSSPTDFLEGPVLFVRPNDIAQARYFLRHAYEGYTLRVARPNLLPVLIKLNVLNAVTRNAVLMGFPPEGLCRDEFISPYSEHGPRLPLPRSCPDILTATVIQRRIPHHPWIDLFPFPRFRDNVVRAVDAGLFDEDELCLDILEARAGVDVEEKPALIVWGESSDPQMWEVNVPFLRKWGWLMRDCMDMLEGTNMWRERRGERLLPLPHK